MCCKIGTLKIIQRDFIKGIMKGPNEMYNRLPTYEWYMIFKAKRKRELDYT
jgi:hypothetical protein